jgi:hypothetical protein
MRFAKHVVIPIYDGYKPEKAFQALLDGLHEEFQPVGIYEEWLIVKVAECMWRLRRATRCESGSVRQSAICNDRTSWDDRLENHRAMNLVAEIWALERLEEELRTSGSLSQKHYLMVLPLVEERRKRVQTDRVVETTFDREEFLTCITGTKESLELEHRMVCIMQDERSGASSDHNSLLPEGDMDRIFRYEERMHRQIDWAVQRFLESQDRRKTVESSRDAALHVIAEDAKRSQ